MAFNYGGQAVVEGVMMRGRTAAAVAVRAPTGAIVLREEVLDAGLYGPLVARVPLVRGVILLWDMLILGTRMMLFAAAVAHPITAADAALGQPVTNGDAPLASDAAPACVVDAPAGAKGTDTRLIVTLVVALACAVGFFFVLPLAVVGMGQRWLNSGWQSLAVEGALRLALLLGYLALIGRLDEIQRVFAYHGAEHKAINTYEAGQPLDVAHVRAASRVHIRCGTGFLLIVVVVSIVVFALVGRPALPLRIVSRVVLVPVIAAIAYELLRLGAASYRWRVVRWLMAPSLALQGLTTREPDDAAIECAIIALTCVLRRDGVLAHDAVA